MKNIIISEPIKLEEIIRNISQDGKDKLHIIADFDGTLTKAFVNGKEIPSPIYVLRNGEYLTEDYSQKAHALRDKYYPIEIDPNISIGEKKGKMQEWWTAHSDLLIKSKLNKKDIEKIVKSEKIKFREGVSKFLDFLYRYNIPLIIMSSAGLGIEFIQIYFEDKKRFYDNIHIISNSFRWDKEGYAVSINKPIIHSMNKDETLIKEFPFYNLVKNRKNVLLLGNSLGDIGMVKGFKYNNLIKIGFLNTEIDKNLQKYKENYDVVILNDGGMNYINKLLRKSIKN